MLEELEKIKQRNLLIIVEGKNDLAALLELGFKKNNIFVLKNGKQLQQDIEEIIGILEKRKEKSCIILTDFDYEGKKLYHILKRNLNRNRIKVEDKIRHLLLKDKISHIEGLATFIENHYQI
ncbi:MAG: toprim domain-containing protein [archaeon]|nr:MAG: toprim domain-containing protein [archaeon]